MLKPTVTALLACLVVASGRAAAPDLYDAQAREIFAKVISVRTEIGQGQVPAMAAYLAGLFRAVGFPEADIQTVPLGETASLVVRYRGTGNGGRPIALMAHMDVVTAKPEDWLRDPFTLVEEDGFFFGRGTYDVKDGVTMLTSTFLRLKAEGFVPTRDLIIVFTGDEETQQDTTRDLVTHHRNLIDSEFALNTDAGGGILDEVGRPQIYYLQTAEKTYVSFELATHNPGGHSSLPRRDNAIYELADALEKVRAYRFPVMWSDTTLAEFKAQAAVTPGPLGEAMGEFARNPKDQAAADVLYDNPSEVGKTRTTCVATMLRGGHADNALPQSATATVNCRIFPGVAVDAVKQALQDVVGPNVSIATIGRPASSDRSPLRKDVLDAVERTVHARHPGVPVVPAQESGATDGLFFRSAGIPTYGVSGIFIKHSDEFAHGLNERVPVKSFYDALDHWHRLLTDLAGSHQEGRSDISARAQAGTADGPARRVGKPPDREFP
jgi:acetylornithine deacetylase/succinyl-diaminopimelate desuccinylase-like protein